MRRFVISNLQLGRPHAIKNYDRPFDSVDKMDAHIINQWNSVVKDGDLVYHIGNFAWDPKTAQDAISKLNGTIWFIPGELDDAIIELGSKNMLPEGGSIREKIMPLHKMKVTLSYWPLKEWPNKSDGYWSIVGHPAKEYKSNPKDMTINVSADLWKFKPQELQHLLGIFQDL